MTDYFTSTGKALRLGKAVGSGGEATVYQVQGQAARLAKLYSRAARPGYAEKLAWMAAHPPENDPAAPGHRALAWPLELVYTARGPERNAPGALAGYLMPYVRGAAPLLEVFNPRLRGRILPGFDRRYLHRAARNLASALAALHAHDYVVGDLNESNILVTPSALVTLIDVDSFQVVETLHGGEKRLHACPVGKLEYTPPELQGQALAETARRPEHDAFGLGVLIFQLLMEGNHPFRARWLAAGDPPPLEQRIAAGMFPYVAGHEARLRPPQGAPPLEQLAPRLVELVRRCFGDARGDPSRRPTPAEWARALADAERSLVSCSHGHWSGAHLATCPACGEARRPAGGVRRPAAAAAAADGAQQAAPRPPAPEPRPANSPPPGTRNPRPAATPTGARPTRAARPTPPPQAQASGPGGGPMPGAAPGRAASGATSGAPPHTQSRPPNSPAPSAELQRKVWAFARRQAVTMLRRRYPWIPAEWAGAPAAPAASAGTGPAAGAAQPSAPNPGAPNPGGPNTGGSNPRAANPGAAFGGANPGGWSAPPATSARPAYTASTQTAQTGQAGAPSPGAAGPLPRAPYGAPGAYPAASTPAGRGASAPPALQFWLRSLGGALMLGAGRGLLAGAAPGLAVAVAAGLIETAAGWPLLAGLGGAAGAAVSAWTPNARLTQLIERHIGWRPLLGGLGLLLGAGLGALASLPIFFLVIPVILGLFFGGKIGLNAGRWLHDRGAPFGWERIWRWGGLALVTAGGAWLGSRLAGAPLGLEIGAWSATQAAAFSTWVGSPAAAWALAGALAGGLAGAVCGFAVDLPARLTRLAE